MENHTNVDALDVRYFDNETGYGFLVNQPGITPIIYLNRTLLGKNPTNALYQQVYMRLIEYYKTVNIWEMLVPFVRYYEELLPTSAPAHVQVGAEAGPGGPDGPGNSSGGEIIILGRFSRLAGSGSGAGQEVRCKECEIRQLGYRLIG